MVAAFHGSRANDGAARPRIIPQALPAEHHRQTARDRFPHAEQGNSAARQAKKESPCPPSSPPKKNARREQTRGTNAGERTLPRQTQSPRTTRRASTARPSGRSSRSVHHALGARADTPAQPQARHKQRAPPSLPVQRRGSVTLPAGRAPAGRPPRRARPARQKDAFRRAGLRAVRPRRAQIPAALSRRHPARASARSPRPCR